MQPQKILAVLAASGLFAAPLSSCRLLSGQLPAPIAASPPAAAATPGASPSGAQAGDATPGPTPEPTPDPTPTPTPTPGVLTFKVTVPANTPADEPLYVVVSTQIPPVPLQPAGENRFTATLPVNGQKVYYTYTRALGSFSTAEEFSPDRAPGDWNKARSVDVPRDGTIVEESVARWRWLPAPGEALPTPPPSTAATVLFPARAGNRPFKTGVCMSDYWDPAFLGRTPAAIAHVKGLEAGWVQLSPNAWQTGDPAAGDVAFQPFPDGQYNEADLRAQTRLFRAAGLEVVWSVGVANQYGDADGLSQSAWEAWLTAYAGHVQRMAAIAQEEGVAEIGLRYPALVPGYGASKDTRAARWGERLAEIRAIFKGKIAYELHLNAIFEELIPYTAFLPIAPLFDEIGFVMWDKVAETGDASVADIRAHVAEQFDRLVEPVWKQTGKPLYVSQLAFPSAQGAPLGDRLYPADIKSILHWESYDPAVAFDFVGQARAYEGIMAEVAARPYLVGTFSFAQPYWISIDKNYSVRGKPAGSILAGWYARAPK